ncbi:MAG: S1 RNA-binding domain-containing protein, partial [Thiotrichaceae bacterium]|nr:S1 RNA-binding domain-containing protein [Thiotrichaceae bacterium]
IELIEGVEAYIRVSELSRERVEDATSILKVGDTLEAKFIGVDRKSRVINLSVKAKDVADEAEVMQEYTDGGSGTTSLGALLKDQLSKK